MKDKIKVSICCVTYNQEDYIKEALDSFINQNVDFKYEIIIHDDASTDNTTKIIEEYQKKYPDLIFPIIEKENQYSKNPNSIVTIPMKKARGEYIALCDGDDKWSDKNKLQLQVKCMDDNPKIKLCFHNTNIIDNKGICIDKITSQKKGKVTITDFIIGKTMMHTSSMLFRKKDIINLPDYFNKATVADLPLKLYLLSLGDGFNINRIMSIYRENAKGSWSEIQKKDKDKYKKNFIDEIELYKNFNIETNKKYDSLITNKILNIEFIYYKNTNDLKKIKQRKYKKLYKNLTIKEKIKIYLKNIKFIYAIYSKIKKRRYRDGK